MEDKLVYQVYLSPAAAEQIKNQLSQRRTPEAYLRLGVKGGGCSGLSYILRYEDSAPTSKDITFEIHGVNVVIDRKSIIYLNQCTLDWEHTLMRQGFTFNNPQEASKCGCGTSFSV